MGTDMLISLLFSGGTGLAGLILVFLGGTINAYEAYSTLVLQVFCLPFSLPLARYR